MKNKILIKILLDAVMTVLYVLLMFGYGISPLFHEVFGILTGLLFVFHIWLNLPMLKALGKRVQRSRGFSSDRATLISDGVLTVCMPVVIISGLMISGVLFSTEGSAEILTLHNIASYLGLASMAAHLLLHAKYLYAVGKITAKRFGESSMKKTAGRFAAAVAAVVIVYSITQSVFSGKTAADSADAGSSGEISYVQPSQSFPQYIEESGETEEDEDKQQYTETETQQTQDTPTLSEYLGSLHCTGCGRHCSLLSPHCGRGQQQAETAESEYQELYQTA